MWAYMSWNLTPFLRTSTTWFFLLPLGQRDWSERQVASVPCVRACVRGVQVWNQGRRRQVSGRGEIFAFWSFFGTFSTNRPLTKHFLRIDHFSAC